MLHTISTSYGVEEREVLLDHARNLCELFVFFLRTGVVGTGQLRRYALASS